MRKEDFIGLETIVRKEVNRFMRIWTQTLLPSVTTMVLYFLIFGAFIGSQIREIQGFSYMQFIVPGLIMMAVITNAYSNVTSSFFGSKFQRAIDEILISPLPNSFVILGYVVGGAVRGILVGALVTLTSLVFIPFHVEHPLTVVIFVILTAVVFSLAGLMNGIFAKKFDDVAIVPTFVLTPLTYLGGVFYSISVLPTFWQGVSKLNPILYMINGFRYGFLGISDVDVVFGLSMLILFTTVLFLVNLRLLDRGIGLKN